MASWIDLGSEITIFGDDILAVIDWTQAKISRENRELVGYARAHGFLIEQGDGPKSSMVITKNKIFLLAVSARSIRKKLDRT